MTSIGAPPVLIRQKERLQNISFCLISTGGAPMDTIRGYIESQGERNAH